MTNVPDSVMSGEVAHEDLLLLHLAGLLVEQTGRDVQGCRIRGIPLFAFFNRILGVLVQPVIDELQHEVAGVVLDRGNVVEDLMQALLQEPVVRVFWISIRLGIPITSLMWEKLMRVVLPFCTGLTFTIKCDHSYSVQILFLAKALRRSNDFLGTFVVFNKV